MKGMSKMFKTVTDVFGMERVINFSYVFMILPRDEHTVLYFADGTSKDYEEMEVIEPVTELLPAEEEDV